jgi:putative FmdB family regulatory protein
MPIYEFYCPDCNTIFSFFSRKVDTRKTPDCPRCGRPKLSRQVSLFAVTGKAREEGDSADPPFDEGRMERAMQMLAGEAEHLNEDDPKQAARLMRKLTDMTGLPLGDGMSEALQRMAQGEDPEKIEADMGDLLDGDDPFQIKKKGRGGADQRRPPLRDETLYDL